MLARIHGKIQFECDACGASLDTETSDFTEARRILRDRDWRTQQIGSDWVHTCDGCAVSKPARDDRARRAGRIP
jgi:hypothetical protein